MALTAASENGNIAKTFHERVFILGTLFHAGVSSDTVAQHWTEMASPVDESSIIYHMDDEIGTFVAAGESILLEAPASADSRDELLQLKAAVIQQMEAARMSHAVHKQKGAPKRTITDNCVAVEAFAFVDQKTEELLYTVLDRYALNSARLWSACTSADLAALKAEYEFVNSSEDIAMLLRFYVCSSRHTTPSAFDIGACVELARSAYKKKLGQKRRDRH
jgi:hypothetical protein